jgi:hypothetical protein
MPAIQNEMSYAFNAAGAAISAAGVAIQETKTFFQNHWAIVAPILAGIAAGASAFYIITGAMKVWHGVTLLATAAQGLFNLTLAANPIGIAVIAIGLLVAAGVALWMNWDVVSAKASALWTTIENAFKKGVNGAIGLINELIETIIKIPGVNIPLVAKVRLDTSENSVVEGMPTGHNAAGTDRWRGGPTWVGEEGPEIINLPRGSQVIPNHKIFGLPQVNQSEHLTQNIFKNYISGLRQERQTMASQTPPPYKREHLTQSSVTVHMNGTTIREDADVHKLANAIVLQLDLAAANM